MEPRFALWVLYYTRDVAKYYYFILEAACCYQVGMTPLTSLR